MAYSLLTGILYPMRGALLKRNVRFINNSTDKQKQESADRIINPTIDRYFAKTQEKEFHIHGFHHDSDEIPKLINPFIRKGDPEIFNVGNEANIRNMQRESHYHYREGFSPALMPAFESSYDEFDFIWEDVDLQELEDEEDYYLDFDPDP